MPKILFISGRKKVMICFLSILSKCLINVIQEEIASGKKLYLYLFDLHIISRKVLRILPLNKALESDMMESCCC